jgi:hypothetical protein
VGGMSEIFLHSLKTVAICVVTAVIVANLLFALTDYRTPERVVFVGGILAGISAEARRLYRVKKLLATRG